jgi:hypothetical protein
MLLPGSRKILPPGSLGDAMVDWAEFPEHLRAKLASHPAILSLRRKPRLHSDTSDFVKIDYGDVIHVDNRWFLVTGYTKEGRFGIDDQPKLWVPKVYDLESDQRLILKLVFHENYQVRFGGIEVTCYRTPEKEAKVIELTRGNPLFMQGYSALDEVGNLVRILDIVQGKRLDQVVYRLTDNHREYFENHLHGLLIRFLESAAGIGWLHRNGLNHGDIRRDHLFVDREYGHFCWIDFDYDFYLPERPGAIDLIGLGSVLLFLVGQQTFRANTLLKDPNFGESVVATINSNDLALLGRDRIYNLRKIYHYIPKPLNDILLHFSAGTSVIYDEVDEFCDALQRAMSRIW